MSQLSSPPPPLSAGRACSSAATVDQPASGPAGGGRGPDLPVQALRARKKGEEDGWGPAKGRRPEQEDEREEESAGKPVASDRGLPCAGMWQHCCWWSQCRAKSWKCQRRAVCQEPCWKNQSISGEKNKRVPTKLHYMRCKIDLLVLEAQHCQKQWRFWTAAQAGS